MTHAVSRLLRIRAGYGRLRRVEGIDRTLILGTAGTIALNVGQTLLNFALTFSLSRLLGADGLGAYAYAFAWATLLAVPSVLGLTPLVVRNVATYREQEEWGLLRGMLARANHAVLISSALLVVGGAGAALLVNGSKHELLGPVLVALLFVPLVALTSIRQATMQGLGRVVLGRIPETLVAPAFLLILLGAVRISDRNLSALLAVALQVSSLFVAFVLGNVLLRRVLPTNVKVEPAEHAMREWIRSAKPLLLFGLIQALYAQVGVILLGAIRTPADAGLFSVANRASGLVTFALIAAGYPLSPVIARLHAAGESIALQRTVRRAAAAIFIASVPVAAGVILFARPLLALFGGEFTGGVTALILLVVAQLIFAATGLAGTVLVMTGNESWLVRSVATGAAVDVGLNAILIPSFGLNGAAVAAVVGTAVMNVSLVWYARSRAKVATTVFGI